MGTTKRFNVFRIMRQGQEEKKLFEVKVEPGYKAGTKIRFENDGGYAEGSSQPCDLIFIIEEKPHDRFKRDGANLVQQRCIALREALLGTNINLTGIDGRNITVPVPGATQNGRKITVSGEGLLDRKTNKKGDLIIEFTVLIPMNLADAQKTWVMQHFPQTETTIPMERY
jgi:DnaJ-class molecular chaperone